MLLEGENYQGEKEGENLQQRCDREIINLKIIRRMKKEEKGKGGNITPIRIAEYPLLGYRSGGRLRCQVVMIRATSGFFYN